MNPSVDDRLASIVRSLTDIVLPALPADAGLAQEQTHLAIGHLRIIRAQLDALPAFEAEELSDTRMLAQALLADDAGGGAIIAALTALQGALDQPVGDEHPRQSRIRINGAIDVLIRESAVDGTDPYRRHLGDTLIRMQSERNRKDRQWFSVMGFDSELTQGTDDGEA